MDFPERLLQPMGGTTTESPLPTAVAFCCGTRQPESRKWLVFHLPLEYKERHAVAIHDESARNPLPVVPAGTNPSRSFTTAPGAGCGLPRQHTWRGERVGGRELQLDEWRATAARVAPDATRRAGIGLLLSDLAEDDNRWVRAYVRSVVAADPELVEPDVSHRLREE